ncbi:MAG TPA: proton-conducting transporter membrane subunit, partial [Amycolatopsis sp.]|nr:proton-conducting transporter membrane subunit [Amycolatopsis sp.]
MIASSWLLVAFPALGALVLLVGGKRTNPWGHLLGCATVILSFVYGVALFVASTGSSTDTATDTSFYTWFAVGNFGVDFGFRIDALSLVFVLLITGVGALIHVYSIGYMAVDQDRRRFFGYLNLFVASMLVLVLGNNFVTLYLGWEGVGLASYLLIGWYQDRPSAATAAKKAFLMNRVGDVGLAIAIFLM